MIQKSWKIYILRDPRSPDAVRYVGKTVNKPEVRLSAHLCYARKRIVTHLTCWLRALMADGVEPLIEVVENGPAEQDWIAAERKWIACYRAAGERLVNGTDGGEGSLGKPMSAETRAKLSVANVGRRATAEARARMSAAKRGKPLALKPDSRLKALAKIRARIAAGDLVIVRTPEAIAKAAESCRKTWEQKLADGWTIPDNWSKFRPDNHGRQCTAEMRKKIGDANRSRVMSEEARRRMSVAKKGKAPHNKGLDFHAAREIVLAIGVRDLNEHRRLHDQGSFPPGVPRNPQLSYRHHPEWKGQPHFFGREPLPSGRLASKR